MTKILVVEDDFAVARGMMRGLSRAGWQVELETDGQAALERACDPSYELIVLDLMLPGASGFELLRRLRARIATPVIVVSAKNGLESRVRSFELGAVDFVSKPFWMEELVVRIRSRLGSPARELVAFGNVAVDVGARRVTVGGRESGLTPIELGIVLLLASKRGDAVSREELLDRALVNEAAGERTVDSHVARVRRKLGPSASALQTVRGYGYRLVVEREDEP